MRRWLYTISAAAILAWGSAFAADLTHVPPPAPAFTWTGFYVGVNGGFGQTADNLGNYSNNFGVLASGVEAPGHATGGFGGGQIGANWQIGTFVLGAEADYDGASIKSSALGTPTVAGAETFYPSQNVNWFYTVRGRAGVAIDHGLIYLTGGYAGGGVTDTSLIENIPPTNGVTLTKSGTRNGYVLGGGVEYAFSQSWSFKAEYQYINLGNTGILSGVVVPPNGVTVFSSPLVDHIDTFRVGLNYRFL